MSRRRTCTSRSDSGSEEEGSSPQPKSHCSVSNRDYENTSGPPFLSKDGETFYKGKQTTKKIADFSLELIGEVHQNGHARKDASREGRWLVSMTCSVFSSKETRTVTLTASDFDTSKTLLKRLRFCFPDNSIQLAPPDNLMQAYWQWLQSSYDPNRARKVYQTDHLGLQEDNYWLLDKEIHLWNNSSVAEDKRLYCLATDTKKRATEFNESLLNENYLLHVLTRVMEKSSYFTVNQNSFKMALSFCLTRLIRLKETEETWGESNIGLLFSKEKNCGKSLTLRILAKLQGMRSQRDGLLFSGGNQNTSGTSNKVVLDILSTTTLVVMIDDPLFSKTLGEFLQQLQGGLSQGSVNSGICTPKGSILISSNSDAVERIEGRVQRIDYEKDESFQLDDQKEKELNDLAQENKGFLVAWTMRYVELWYELKEEAIPVLQGAIRAAFPNQQLRWVKGQAYTLLTFGMLHALVQQPFNLLEVISGLHADKPQLTPLQQLQVAAFERMKCDPSQVSTWISPFCNAIDQNGKKLPALAFSKEGIRNLGKDVSDKDIQEELPGPKCIAQPQTFATSGDTPLSKVRRKKGGKVGISKRAHKIPLGLLSELFINWVNFFIEPTEQEPDKPFSQEEFSSHDNPLATLSDKMASLKRTIISKIEESRTKQAKDQAATGSSTESLEHSVVQALSPNTKAKFFSYTQEKQQGFMEGYMYKPKSCNTSPRPDEDKSSTTATSLHNTSKDKRSTIGGQKRKEASGHNIVDQCSPSPSKEQVVTNAKSDTKVPLDQGSSRSESPLPQQPQQPENDTTRRRKRKRQLKSKTYMNDEGFMVTEKVWESESTDASDEELQITSPPVKEKKPSPAKKPNKKTHADMNNSPLRDHVRCDSPESDSSNDDESRNRRSWQDERRPREKTPASQERAMRTDMTEGLFDFSDSDSIF
ncbi:uncharacterized protein LOC144652248 isoform X2 [Oculina patagonica]